METGMKEINHCENCAFWRQLGRSEFGVCRRNTPAFAKVARDELELHDLWPTTFLVWWCGEWSPKPTEQTPDANPR